MACERRERTGSCGHYQCPFEAESGYQCVDVIAGFCEIGEGCVQRCPYAWKDGDIKTTRKALKAFDAHCRRLERKMDV